MSGRLNHKLARAIRNHLSMFFHSVVYIHMSGSEIANFPQTYIRGPTFGCDISDATTAVIMRASVYVICIICWKTKHNKTSATLSATSRSLIIQALDMLRALRTAHKSSNDTPTYDT